METLLSSLGEEIHDVDEESFHIFTQETPTSNLGFIDAHASSIEISIHEKDYEILQSPGLLSSKREGGTTGAVLWKITPLLSTWLSSSTNPLRNTLLNRDFAVVELGCGISSLLALSLGPLVGRYVATDQEYVRRLFRENLLGNVPVAYRQGSNGGGGGGKRGKGGGKVKASHAAEKKENSDSDSQNISFMPLDWEVNSPVGLKEVPGAGNGFDMLVSCDCIYNEALIAPFVRTCAEVCRLREEGVKRKTVCVIAQQQRAPEVFETWLREAMREFRVWRVADEVLGEELKLGSGYVVHLMVLKDVVH